MSIDLNGFWQSWDVVSGNTQANNQYEFWKGMVMSNGQVLASQYDFFTYHNTTRYEWFKALQGTYPQVYDEYTFYKNTNDARIYDYYTFYKYAGEYLVAVAPTPTPTNSVTPTPTPTPSPQVVQWVASSTSNGVESYTTDINAKDNWTLIDSLSSLPTNYMFAVAYNGTRWGALGDYLTPPSTYTKITYYSDNGYEWYSGSTNNIFGASGTQRLVGNSSIWVAGGGASYTEQPTGKTSMAYSYDAINYSAGTITPLPGLPQPNVINGISYDGNMWLAVGASSGATAGSQTKIIYSYDGINWSGQTNVLFTQTPQSVAYGNGLWVVVQNLSSSNAKICASTDGFNWTASTNANSTNLFAGTVNPNNVVFFDNKFIATSGTLNSGATYNLIIYSTDGLNWTPATSARPLLPRGIRAIAENNNFVIVSTQTGTTGNANTTLISSNGVDWSANTGNFNTIFTGSTQTVTVVSSNVPLIPPPNPSATPTPTPSVTQTPGLTPSVTPTNTVTPTPTPSPVVLLLDQYTGATAAYSVRKLRTSYGGNALRVRRSSDNTEQNIGFVNNELDTTSLLSFVGTGGTNNGFITTWYDQSGNSNDMSQSTAANQPQIVSGGTILRVGTSNKPVIKFDGTNDFLQKTSVSFNNLTYSSFVVAQETTQSNNSGIFILAPATGNDYESVNALTLETGSGTDILVFLSDYRSVPGTFSIAESGSGSMPYSLINGMKQSTGAQLLRNNVTKSTVTSSLSGGTSTSILMGARFQGSVSSPYFNGYEQEAIFYLTNQSSNLTNINTNINNYYGIY